MSVVGFPGGKRGDSYRTYRMTSRAHRPLIVLATHLPDAISVLTRWRAKHGIDEVGLSIEPGWGKSLTSVGRAHVEEALARCKGPCVAHRYRADIGWELSSPDGSQTGW
jgi:hypothetical protein